MELLDKLEEMGFSRRKATIALNMTRNAGVEPAVEWILAHPEPDEEPEIEGTRKLSESDGEWDDALETPVSDAPRVPHLELMCDECKLIFTNDIDIEKHMAKFGHLGYIEPPTNAGGCISSELDELNGLNNETDLSFSEEDSPKKVSSAEKSPSPHVKPKPVVLNKKSKTDLQIQLPNGDVLHQTFGVNEELSYVRLFVQLNRTDGDAEFVLTTNLHNGIAFGPEDYIKPLYTLGLFPRAHIFVKDTVRRSSALV